MCFEFLSYAWITWLNSYELTILIILSISNDIFFSKKIKFTLKKKLSYKSCISTHLNRQFMITYFQNKSSFLLQKSHHFLWKVIIFWKSENSKHMVTILETTWNFFKMEEEEAIIKINETNETRYLYKAETGYMNILQTS